MMLCSIDLETWLIEPGNTTPPVVCLAYADSNGAALLNKEEGLSCFRALLSDPELHIGGANISFDLGVLANEDPSLRPLIVEGLREGRFEDTHILEALHDIGRGKLNPKGYSLASLEWRYFRRDRTASKGPDAWRMRYRELDGVPISEWPREAVEYPLDDARGTFEVLQHQLTSPGRLNLHCRAAAMRRAWALAQTSAVGMRTDRAAVEALEKDLEGSLGLGRAEALGRGLLRTRKARGGRKPETPNAPLGMVYQADLKAIRALVEVSYKGAPPRTNKGQVSYSRDTLRESGNPVLEQYSELTKKTKLLTSFIPVLKQGVDHAINARYNPLVSSGRTSCRRPNFQQLPTGGGVRNCFIAPPGHLLLSADYATLELRAAAQICYTLFGRSELREAINGGYDLHLRVAAAVRRDSYDKLLFDYKSGDEATADLRQLCKIVIYGIWGLLGAAKLVRQARGDGIIFCELSGRSRSCANNERVTYYAKQVIPPTCKVCLRVAKELKSTVKSLWPEINEYHAWTKLQAETGILVSFGDGMVRKENRATAAANHYFQNLGAQGAVSALFDCWEELSPLRPAIFAHDELICVVPEELGHECGMLLKDKMEKAMMRFTPDVASKAEPVLMRRWDSDAEPVYEKGRLVPWQA